MPDNEMCVCRAYNALTFNPGARSSDKARVLMLPKDAMIDSVAARRFLVAYTM